LLRRSERAQHQPGHRRADAAGPLCGGTDLRRRPDAPPGRPTMKPEAPPTRWTLTTAALATLAAVSGCARLPPGPRSDPAALPDERGTQLNGQAMNGIILQARALDAVLLSSGVTLRSGSVLKDVHLEGAQLAGGEFRGANFAGALLDAVAVGGTPVRLRIDQI